MKNINNFTLFLIISFIQIFISNENVYARNCTELKSIKELYPRPALDQIKQSLVFLSFEDNVFLSLRNLKKHIKNSYCDNLSSSMELIRIENTCVDSHGYGHMIYVDLITHKKCKRNDDRPPKKIFNYADIQNEVTKIKNDLNQDNHCIKDSVFSCDQQLKIFSTISETKDLLRKIKRCNKDNNLICNRIFFEKYSQNLKKQNAHLFCKLGSDLACDVDDNNYKNKELCKNPDWSCLGLAIDQEQKLTEDQTINYCLFNQDRLCVNNLVSHKKEDELISLCHRNHIEAACKEVGDRIKKNQITDKHIIHKTNQSLCKIGSGEHCREASYYNDLSFIERNNLLELGCAFNDSMSCASLIMGLNQPNFDF